MIIDKIFENRNYAILSADLETSSINKDGQKIGYCYLWGLDCKGDIITGRYIEDFVSEIREIDSLYPGKLYIYFHNLSFDFQFFMKLMGTPDKVIINKDRHPICVKYGKIIFKCSYMLTRFSLEKLGEIVGLPKLKGDLDYKKIRHSETPLHDKEMEYFKHDLEIVRLYIESEVKRLGGIQNVPNTQTGYARKNLREHIFQSAEKYNYMNYIHALTLTEDSYKMAKSAFAGGFTHANAFCTGAELKNIVSYDIVSAYPWAMLTKLFPASPFYECNNFKQLQNADLWTACVIFNNIKVKKNIPDGIISFSKIESISNVYTCNNGRVMSADFLKITITNIDYEIICSMYDFNDVKLVTGMWCYADYLPKLLRESIIDLYNSKNKLKGVAGKEDEYMRKKEILNSQYGQMVTSIEHDKISIVDGEWVNNGEFLEIEQYNTDRGRMLYYPWGVWVTAYVRQRICNAIVELPDFFVYTDTDSCKMRQNQIVDDYFINQNDIIINEVYSLYGNDTFSGKIIGTWDYEGVYDKFKTLGAKRYIYEKDGEVQLVVAGLNCKHHGEKDVYHYIKGNIFEAFSDDLTIPSEYTGKRGHWYIDNQIDCDIIDYAGKESHIICPSGVYLEEIPFHLSLSKEYINYLKLLGGFEK